MMVEPVARNDASGEVILGMPEGRRSIGLVLKRTYRLQNGGGCDAVEEDEQEPLSDAEIPYDELDPPLVSPVQVDNDLLAFRRKTDIVVQGNAYTYFSGVSMTHVAVRIGSLDRLIRVYGDRELLRGLDGKLRFGRAEPFDTMPVRYDRAYGGVDVTALRRRPAPQMLRELAQVMPDIPIDTETPFHYGRNPCGRGFLIDDDDESLAELQVPNLEFPFDCITPERLATGSIHSWVTAPLPACMDWQSIGWFPRIAYLGGAWFPPHYKEQVRETKLGWAAADLAAIQPITWHPDELPRFEFAQAASAGMSMDWVSPGEMVELRNMHPVYPFCTFQLPHEIPRVRMELSAGEWTELKPHLNAVVIRPDVDEVVMIWCLTAPIERTFEVDDGDEIRRKISWQIGGGY